MKKVFIIALGVIALVSGCSSAESTAEKALQEIGNGLYKSEPYAISSFVYSLNKKLFTDCYAYTELGEEFVKYGGVGAKGSISDSKLVESCFDTDYLFDTIKLVDKEESTMDIYGYRRRFLDDADMVEFDKQLEGVYSRLWKDFRCNDYVMAGLRYESIPACWLKYKLDGKYLSDVLVLKIPKEGWRVAYVSML